LLPDSDPGAEGGEPTGDPAADPGPPAGDDGDAVREQDGGRVDGHEGTVQ